MKRMFGFLIIVIMMNTMTGGTSAFEFDDLPEQVEIHGFISQGFLQSDGNNFYANTKDGTFQFNEFGLNFSVDLTDRLHTSIQLLSRDIGDIGNNELQIDLAYADYRWKDWLGFRIGKVKVNYGLYNETRDIDMLRTSILLPQSIYPETLRDIYHSLYGFEIYGYCSLGFLGNLNYQFQTGQKNITTNSGIGKFFAEDPLALETELKNFELRDITTFSLDWETFLDGMHFKFWLGTYALEAILESPSDITRDGELLPAGTEFRSELEKRWRIILSAEYIGRNIVLASELQGEADNLDASLTLYLGGAVRITDWLEVGAYYSESYFADVVMIGDELEVEQIDEDAEPDLTELVVTTRFDLNEQWTLKLEGHFIEGTGAFFEQDNPDGLEEESTLLAVKTTFNF